MKPLNIVKFALIFCTCYFILIALHQLKQVRSVHNNIFIATEQVVFNIFNPNIRIDLEQYKETPGVPYHPEYYDHSFIIFDKKQYRNAANKRRVSPVTQLSASLDNTTIGPILLFLSLMIATPMLWWRKILGVLGGIFLIYIMIAFKYSYMFATNISTIPSTGVWGFLSEIFGSLRTHENLLWYVVFFWVIIAIRSKQLKWFVS